MSVHDGHRMRAFRPSHLAWFDAWEEDAELQKLREVNIRLYAQRVEAGIPLFEETSRSEGRENHLR